MNPRLQKGLLVVAWAFMVGAWLLAEPWTTGVRAWIYGTSRVVSGSSHENEELQAQLQVAQSENERLRALLKLPQQGWRLSMSARCLYRDGEQPQSDLWVDRGQRDGVSTNTVALHSNGLVGRVVEVREQRSRIRPTLHPQSRVPVLLGTTGLQGVAHGRAWSLEVEQVRARPQVPEGALVTTSGLGQVYPGAVLVGRVRRSLPSSDPLFARYEVEPSVFLDQVLEVLLVEVQP